MKKIFLSNLFFLFCFCVNLYSSPAGFRDDKRATVQTGLSVYPDVAVSSNGTIHIVWEDNKGGGVYEVYYSRSTDNGRTWSSALSISSDDGFNSQKPRIGVNANGTVFVAWQDKKDGNFKIHGRVSADGGISFQMEKKIGDAGYDLVYPSLGSYQNKFYITWEGNGDTKSVYVSCVNENGDTEFTKQVTSDSVQCGLPSLSVSSSGIHLAYQTTAGAVVKSYYVKCGFGGDTAIQPVALSSSDSNSEQPRISSDGSYAYMVWKDIRNENWDVYFSKIDGSGNKIIDNQRMTTDSNNSFSPSISMSSGNLAVVWHDNRDDLFATEIYSKKSADYGVNWLDDTRLTNSSGNSQNPAITGSGNNLFIVWQDERDGNYEIYFKTTDSVSPSFSITTSPSGYFREGNVAVSVNSGEIVPSMNLSYSLSGEPDSRPVPVSSSDSVTWAGTLEIKKSDANGQGKFYVNATDEAGNSGSAITSGETFTVDTKEPSAIIYNESPAKVGTNKFRILVSEELQYLPLMKIIFPSGQEKSAALQGSGRDWKADIILHQGIGEGDVKFLFSGTDYAGNKGTEITQGGTYSYTPMIDRDQGGTYYCLDDSVSYVQVPPGAVDRKLRIEIKKAVSLTENQRFTGQSEGFSLRPVSVFDIDAIDAKGNRIANYGFLSKVSVKLKYDENNVLGAEPAKLGLFYFNGLKWVNAGTRKVEGGFVHSDISHLSRFAIFETLSSSTVQPAGSCAPNPFCPAGTRNKTFFNMTPGASEFIIRIFNVNGALVRTLRNLDYWDGKDESSGIVEGGLYIYQIKGLNAEIVTGTVVVVR